MNPIQITLKGNSLASRAKAAEFRRIIEPALESAHPVRIDLAGVESISHSFADELFGVIALQHGTDYLVDNVKVLNASDDIMLVIAQCIYSRTSPQRMTQGPIATNF